MENQLQELIGLQREQNSLLRKYLWRLRFSLLSLLLLTTATSIGLGVLVYQLRQPAQARPTVATPLYQTWAAPTPPQPAGPAQSDDLFGPATPPNP